MLPELPPEIWFEIVECFGYDLQPLDKLFKAFNIALLDTENNSIVSYKSLEPTITAVAVKYANELLFKALTQEPHWVGLELATESTTTLSQEGDAERSNDICVWNEKGHLSYKALYREKPSAVLPPSRMDMFMDLAGEGEVEIKFRKEIFELELCEVRTGHCLFLFCGLEKRINFHYIPVLGSFSLTKHLISDYHVVGSFRCKYELEAVRIYTSKEPIWKRSEGKQQTPRPRETFTLPWYLIEGVGGETLSLEVRMEKRAVEDDAPSVWKVTPFKVTNVKLLIEDVEVHGPVIEGKGDRSS